MDDALRGDAPSNHLFGCARLPKGWTFDVPPRMAHLRLKALPFSKYVIGAMWAAVGDPLQTIWVLRNARRRHIVWATTQAIAPSLGILRRIGVLKAPLAVLVHNTASKRYTRFWLRGADAVVVFSDGIRLKLIEQGVAQERIHVARWGPDTRWSGYRYRQEDVSLDFISTGKTYRDYDSLLEAARLGKLSGVIMNGTELIRISGGIPEYTPNRPRLSNAEVIQELSRARVVVIPIADPPDPKGLTGITELADAVAIGKPVVMTANPLLPVDIEAAGIGAVIPNRATANEILSAIQRAQCIDSSKVMDVAKEWNEESFSAHLLEVFRNIA